MNKNQIIKTIINLLYKLENSDNSESINYLIKQVYELF